MYIYTHMHTRNVVQTDAYKHIITRTCTHNNMHIN